MVQAELVKSHFLLLALDSVVLLLLGAAWKTLPRETTAQKVQDYVSNGLQIVTTRLLVANMGVDGGVTSSTSEIFAVSERNVLTFRVLVALGETKIDNVDVVFRVFTATYKEVVWLDIAVNNALLVHFLNAMNHLDSDLQTSLEIKLASALLE